MDCANPPHIDEDYTEDLDWQIIHINRKDKTCLIRKGNGEKVTGRSYSCTLADWLIEGVMLGDFVTVEFNPVTRKRMVTDYRINTVLYARIHNSYQEELPEAERDYIYNEKGELYE